MRRISKRDTSVEGMVYCDYRTTDIAKVVVH